MKPSKETDKTTDKKSDTRFTSGGTLAEMEFFEGIKSAEEGPFYTVQESMNHFEKWLKEKEKK